MARVVLTSAGTLGDFLPLVRLGKRLRERGHEVRCAFNPAMLILAQAEGLQAVPCGRPSGAAEARRRHDCFDFWIDSTDEEVCASWERLDLEDSYRDLLAACADADLLVASRLQYVAPMVHERTGIPWISVEIMPAECPHPGDPQDCNPPEPLASKVCAIFNRVRDRVGLRRLAVSEWSSHFTSGRLLLVASSRHFSQPCLEVCSQLRMTGFWFDELAPDWRPDAELQAFLDVSPAPLLLTLSSQAVADPEGLVALHAEAASSLERRLLVQSGWAGLQPGDRDPCAVRVVGQVPHVWLFPRVAAVIHHGGVGTTAEALRHGRPMLVEPHGNDQFFNARRVLALGVGAAMHPHKLTTVGLTRILGEKVLLPSVEQQAQGIARRLHAEDGLTVACDLVEQELRGLAESTRLV